MREDAPVPERVPRKRRAIERAPDRWLAVWLTRQDLSAGEVKLLQEEKARRKAAVPDKRVGLLVGPEGCTPEQREAMREKLAQLQPTEIHHPGVARNVHGMARSLAPVTIHRDDLRAVIRASDMVVAVPSSPRCNLWDAVRYARHRRLVVAAFASDGAPIDND